MIIKRMIPYLLTGFLLILTVFLVGNRDEKTLEKQPDKATADEAPAEEIRGVWLAYMTLDVENETDKERAFRDKIDAIVREIKQDGFNTLFVQVRPFCDAIYPSAYYPWSHIISGTQGVDPGFDPLRIICDKCAEAEIGVHAWINPYRIRTQSTPAELCEDHPYSLDPSLGVVVNGETYLQFSDERVRDLIVSGVIELLENYDIDGIQFDDYFYPEDCGDFDAEAYASYCEAEASPLPLEDFRRENISQMIRDVWQAVHSTKPNAVFGVSPQGNLANNNVIYADVVRWCAEEGYIDYICPQLYYSPDNPAQRFEDALRDWLTVEKHPGLRLLIGLGGYKAGTDADEGTWLDSSDILKTELQILQEEECDGFLLYSYDSLVEEASREEIKNLVDYLTEPTQ